MFWYSAPPASTPEPRLTARSMLSFGTDVLRAFWIASYRVGLPSGSPPPVRAATSMFLISFANSLPRLASRWAFLCLVVAHLEWPLMYLSQSSAQTVRAPGRRRSVLGGTRWPGLSPAQPQRFYLRRHRPLASRARWPARSRDRRPTRPTAPG